MAFLICALIIAGVAIICAAVVLNSRDAQPESRMQTNMAENRETGYVIKDFNGRLAVYRADNLHDPERVTQIYSQTLRIYDQELLRDGIKIADEEELWRILEDYGS